MSKKWLLDSWEESLPYANSKLNSRAVPHAIVLDAHKQQGKNLIEVPNSSTHNKEMPKLRPEET